MRVESSSVGPGASPSGRAVLQRPSLSDAEAYCRRLARGHYENFVVASWFLPRRLRQHFYNVYAYCRWADDLADETGDRAVSLKLLGQWEDQLDACYRGQTEHPVFIALMRTIREFEIPSEPFRDLLVAFRRDQQLTRYESIDELLDYCRHSANPVGRLVLYLGRCHDADRVALSDSICTGLQLANLWQDLGRDVAGGRCYLPRDVCRQHGYDDAMLARRECNEAFRQVIRGEVDRAAAFLTRGAPLAERVPKSLQRDVFLFVGGGLEVLKGIERIGYDVWHRRPTVGRAATLRLLLRSCWNRKPATWPGGIA